MADNKLLQQLEGIESRFREVATLITDPAVIADMQRYEIGRASCRERVF